MQLMSTRATASANLSDRAVVSTNIFERPDLALTITVRINHSAGRKNYCRSIQPPWPRMQSGYSPAHQNGGEYAIARHAEKAMRFLLQSTGRCSGYSHARRSRSLLPLDAAQGEIQQNGRQREGDYR